MDAVPHDSGASLKLAEVQHFVGGLAFFSFQSLKTISSLPLATEADGCLQIRQKEKFAFQ